MHVYICIYFLTGSLQAGNKIQDSESCICKENRHKALGKVIQSQALRMHVQSHSKRMLKEDDHKQRQVISQNPRSSSLWSILGMLIPCAVMCYWTRVSTQSFLIFLLPFVQFETCLCWQRQGPIICTFGVMVNANLGAPFVSEWGEVICLSEASCAGVIKVIMNFHCRGRVPVRESNNCSNFCNGEQLFVKVTSLSWWWQSTDIKVSNVEEV